MDKQATIMKQRPIYWSIFTEKQSSQNWGRLTKTKSTLKNSPQGFEQAKIRRTTRTWKKSKKHWEWHDFQKAHDEAVWLLSGSRQQPNSQTAKQQMLGPTIKLGLNKPVIASMNPCFLILIYLIIGLSFSFPAQTKFKFALRVVSRGFTFSFSVPWSHEGDRGVPADAVLTGKPPISPESLLPKGPA